MNEMNMYTTTPPPIPEGWRVLGPDEPATFKDQVSCFLTHAGYYKPFEPVTGWVNRTSKDEPKSIFIRIDPGYKPPPREWMNPWD